MTVIMASLLRTARNCLRGLQNPALQSFRCQSDNFEIEYKKTEIKVDMLSKEDEQMMYMESYSQMGFRLNTGVRIIGPCAVFPRSILHWNVRGVEDINEDSLSLFTILEPKLDILIIGKGDRTASVSPKIYTYLRSKKLNVEILPTDQALATFNFLNSEKRYVAGAFIPPEYVDTKNHEDDGIEGAIETRNIYELSTDYHEPSANEPQELKGWQEHRDLARKRVKDSLSKHTRLGSQAEQKNTSDPTGRDNSADKDKPS